MNIEQEKSEEQDIENQETETQNDTKEEKKEMDKDFLDKIIESDKDNKKDIVINYRIIHNHGIMAGDDASIENVKFNNAEKVDKKQKKKIILSDEKKFNEWLSENYETYSMALLIAAAVFDALPYEWIVQAAETLFQTFKPKKDLEEKIYGLTETLGWFGAVICKGELNTYTGTTQVEVVRLSKNEYQELILKYIWRECPKLHDNIMHWLEDYIFQRPLSMSKRAGDVIGQLVCWDYYYFLNNMTDRIQHENSMFTDMIIAQNVVALSKKDFYKKNVYHLLNAWSKKKNVHYLLSGLWVCAELTDKNDIMENNISCYIYRAMQEIHKQNLGEYMQNIDEFFMTGVRAFSFYRILVEKIYEQVNGASSKKAKDVCTLFLSLFAVDIKLAQIEDGEDALFIKLCMTKQAVSYQLCHIWQTVWRFRQYRQIFYTMMAMYVEKLGKNTGNRLEKFINRAFEDICTEEVRNDICSKIHRRVHNE